MNLPFTLRVTFRAGAAKQVMRTTNYDFARKVALRRVSMTAVAGQEADLQPTQAEVHAGNGDLLFSVRRVTQMTPSGRRLVRIIVDKDWHFEDSPFKPGKAYQVGTYEPQLERSQP